MFYWYYLLILFTLSIVCLFLTVPWVGLKCVIIAYPGNTHISFTVYLKSWRVIECDQEMPQSHTTDIPTIRTIAKQHPEDNKSQTISYISSKLERTENIAQQCKDQTKKLGLTMEATINKQKLNHCLRMDSS